MKKFKKLITLFAALTVVGSFSCLAMEQKTKTEQKYEYVKSKIQPEGLQTYINKYHEKVQALKNFTDHLKISDLLTYFQNPNTNWELGFFPPNFKFILINFLNNVKNYISTIINQNLEDIATVNHLRKVNRQKITYISPTKLPFNGSIKQIEEACGFFSSTVYNENASLDEQLDVGMMKVNDRLNDIINKVDAVIKNI